MCAFDTIRKENGLVLELGDSLWIFLIDSVISPHFSDTGIGDIG